MKKGQFVAYLENNLRTSSASGGSQLVIHDDCPFCGASGGKIYVDVKKEVGIDHKCGRGFGAIAFVCANEGVGAAKADAILEGSKDVFATEEEEKPATGRWFPQCVALDGEASDYMRGRGFSLEFCRSMGLSYCPTNTIDHEGKTHYTAGRVIIPIYDIGGAVCGWQGRDITGRSKIKYLIQPGFDAGKSLYNIQNVKPGAPVIIVEGVMDAWGWIRAGAGNVVATWGKKISEEQVTILAGLKPTVVFNAWDGDAALKRYEFAEKFGHVFDIRIVAMKDKDADQLGVEDLYSMLLSASKYSFEGKVKSLLSSC